MYSDNKNIHLQSVQTVEKNDANMFST